ncbi:MAG: vWA domain-containing protein [Candidatus Binatia bacterium]
MATENRHDDILHRAIRRPWWWRFSPRNPEFRDEIESYGASVVVHLLLLLLLGLVTLSGGGGKGDRVGEGADGKMAQGTADSALSAQALEQIMKKERVKPLETELPRPNPQKVAPQLSQLIRTAPTQSVSAAGIGGGYGGGIGTGIGKDFGDFLGLLKRAGFDAVFVIDASGSMQYVIDETRRKVTRLVDIIQRLVPVARVGFVLYRDKGEEFVVRKSDLTFHGSKLQSFLSGVEAGGGGDWEEGLKDGLEAAVSGMTWRSRSKKIIVLVASSPPHKEDVPAIQSIADGFRRRGGIISTIDVSEPAHAEFEKALHRTMYGKEPEKISPLPDFYREIQTSLQQIARSGGGDMVALGEDAAIMREIMVVAFGKEWESKVAKYAKEL